MESSNYIPIVKMTDDPYEPYNMIYRYMFVLLPPEEFKHPSVVGSIRIFQREASFPLQDEWRAKKLPYILAPGNRPYGKNFFTTALKRHAKIFGYDNPEKCTFHGKGKTEPLHYKTPAVLVLLSN